MLLLMVASIADNPYVQLLYGAIANGQQLPTPPYECWRRSDGTVQESCGYATYGGKIPLK